jgi:hypothetical protein
MEKQKRSCGAGFFLIYWATYYFLLSVRVFLFFKKKIVERGTRARGPRRDDDVRSHHTTCDFAGKEEGTHTTTNASAQQAQRARTRKEERGRRNCGEILWAAKTNMPRQEPTTSVVLAAKTNMPRQEPTTLVGPTLQPHKARHRHHEIRNLYVHTAGTVHE